MAIEQDIIGAIDAIFSADKIQQEDKAALAFIHQEAQKMPPSQKQALADYLISSQLPQDNLIPMYFYLYDCFADMRFLERLAKTVPETPSVSWFYELYWNLSHRSFRSGDSSAELQAVLRDRFYCLGDMLRQFLAARGMISKQLSFAAPKNIAIITPQLMNMRHSPTREAYNIALHLTRDHQCNCTIFNTNAMNYPDCQQLGLLMPADFQVNSTLNGHQQIPIKYMQFEQSINTLSFEPGPMTTQKIANISGALQQLQVDAVIAHGENLLVMEALYGFYPSLFATTGSVVPYNHCDAYFIPGNLLTDTAKQMAAQYQHDNFMLESMLVTPEGYADAPAARADLGLAEDDFLYLVVGTRLAGELESEFITVCEHLLSCDNSIKILFAGTPELALESYFNQEFISTGRVVNLGFQQDLAAISAMCDVYLNPKRAGGGTSSQTAILNGLPVVTLNQGHISAVVPEDKRHGDWERYFNYARSLQEDKTLLRAESELFKEHYFTHLDSAGQIARMYQKLVAVAADFDQNNTH